MSQPRSKHGGQAPVARMREIPGPAAGALAAFDAETEPSVGDEDRAWRRLRGQLRDGEAGATQANPVQRWLVAAVAVAGLAIAVAVGVGQRRQWVSPPTTATAPQESPNRQTAVDHVADAPTIVAAAPSAVSASDAIVPRTLPAERVRLDAHITVVARPGTSAAAWVDREGGQHVDLTSGVVELTVSGSVHPTLVVHAGDYHFRDRGTTFEVGRAGETVWLQVKSGAVAVSKGRRALAVVRARHRWSVGVTDVAADARVRSTAAAPAQPDASSPAITEETAPPAPPVAPTVAAPARPRPTLSDCRALEQQQRDEEAQGCLGALTEGSDLSAESALYELARLQRERQGDVTAALVTLQKQRRRFPDGALRDEAELTTIELLPQVRRYRSALDLSDSFLARHPRHERAAELHLLRGNILREAFADYGAAVSEYQDVDAAEGRVADDAAFFLAIALEADGRKQEAADAYRRYLKRGAPAHGAVARARLAALAR